VSGAPDNAEPIDEQIVEAVLKGELPADSPQWGDLAGFFARLRDEVAEHEASDEDTRAFVHERLAAIEAEQKKLGSKRRRKSGGVAVLIVLSALSAHEGLAAAHSAGVRQAQSPAVAVDRAQPQANAPAQATDSSPPASAPEHVAGGSGATRQAAGPHTSSGANSPDTGPNGMRPLAAQGNDALVGAAANDSSKANSGKHCGGPSPAPSCPPASTNAQKHHP
jgi:hypothetical protein